MGEEEKKPAAAAAEEKKMEEEKKPPQEAKKAEEEKKQETKPAEEKKKEAPEESKEAKQTKEEPAPPPPPPPQETVLKVYMHCEGCARKVRRCLKGFPGVEDVITDCKIHKVVVKGEKADPLKVLERVQRKSHRQVELLSPIPKPPSEEEKKPEAKETPKPEEKKEPQVITVVLKVHMHCEACAQEIKKRILRMKGVESAESDLKSSEVTVKGAFDPPKLVEYVYKRTGKHGVIVKQEPEKKEEKAEEANKEEQKKGSEEGGDKEKEKENKAIEEEKKEGGGGEVAKQSAEATTEEAKVVELKLNEYNHYPSIYGIAMEMNPYPPQPQMWSQYPPQMLSPYAPQMFSDENPNACSVM